MANKLVSNLVIDTETFEIADKKARDKVDDYDRQIKDITTDVSGVKSTIGDSSELPNPDINIVENIKEIDTKAEGATDELKSIVNMIVPASKVYTDDTHYDISIDDWFIYKGELRQATTDIPQNEPITDTNSKLSAVYSIVRTLTDYSHTAGTPFGTLNGKTVYRYAYDTVLTEDKQGGFNVTIRGLNKGTLRPNIVNYDVIVSQLDTYEGVRHTFKLPYIDHQRNVIIAVDSVTTDMSSYDDPDLNGDITLGITQMYSLEEGTLIRVILEYTLE